MIHLKPAQFESRRGGERGITMLEVTLLLAAFAIVTAAVAPAVLRTLSEANARNVMQEMEALHVSVLGDTDGDTFGYVGDIGRFPYFLDELIEQLDQPLQERSLLSGVAYGWNGPYVSTGRDADDFRLDPWGNEYELGIVGAGQIRSAGPNGLFDDADDIVYPAYPVNLYGTVVVTVRAHRGDAVENNPEGCVVVLRYSDSGFPGEVIDDVAPFAFEAVHRGLHEIEATCTDVFGNPVSESAVVAVRGAGAQQVAELHVDLGEDVEDAEARDAGSEIDASTEMDPGTVPGMNPR
jgi:hypothetical protein